MWHRTTGALDEVFSQSREPLASVLDRHMLTIVGLKKDLAREFQKLPGYIDDVFLLRYALSFQAEPERLWPSLRQAVQWRMENETLMSAAHARVGPAGLTEQEIRACECFYPARFIGVTVLGDPLVLCRAASCDQCALMDSVSEEALLQWVSYLAEVVWAFCDAESRRRGHLVKQYTLLDATNVTPAYDQRFVKVLGRLSKQSEWLRPQLVERTIILNPPMWARWAFSIAELFLSKKTLSKVVLHATPVGADEGGAEFGKHMVSDLAVWPDFLGGEARYDELLPDGPAEMATLKAHPGTITVLDFLPGRDGQVAKRRVQTARIEAKVKVTKVPSAKMWHRRFLWNCFSGVVSMCSSASRRSWLM
mmetsp:Transcript_21866/g.51054  ORF Transcript_21866/g.51054 Transcript_21866/m.51054 type:complete len:364 (+) Transcript_21866:112-1203(+)